jgi:phage I-like protein
MRVSELGGTFAFYSPINGALELSTKGSKKGVWILAAVEGTWFNPKYGDVPITEADIEKMFSNYSEGRYPKQPQHLPIDYDHLSISPNRKPGDGKAAGWINDVELRDNAELKRKELWALIEWNDDARNAIQKNEYRGFSPLFHPNWKEHGGKGELGVTLLGGALTNYQTIPECVVTCSLDPGDNRARSPRALAAMEDISYRARIRRVEEAVEARFPMTYKDGNVDYASMVDIRDVFEDRVVFMRNGRLYRQDYTFGSDLSVTFQNEPVEVIYQDVTLSTIHEGEVMKVKNTKGEEIEIDPKSLGALSLDVLSEIPAVKQLREQVPAGDALIVPKTEFETLRGTVTAMSTEITSLKSTNAELSQKSKDADARALEAELASLQAGGKILPADVEFMRELATNAPAVYAKRVEALRAAAPVIKLDTVHGADSKPEAHSAVVAFDTAVAELRKADPKLTMFEAVQKVAAEKPELARARNIALSVPVDSRSVSGAAF